MLQADFVIPCWGRRVGSIKGLGERLRLRGAQRTCSHAAWRCADDLCRRYGFRERLWVCAEDYTERRFEEVRGVV